MANITEESLNKALVELGLAQLGLPKEWNGESDGFWIRAIALVRKTNGDRSYYDIERDANGKISYKKDFGRMSPIAGLIRIYPYQYIDEARFVNVGDAKDRRILLMSQTESQEERDEIRNISDEDVIVRLRKCAIAAQENNSLKDIELNKEQEDALAFDLASNDSIVEERNNIESEMLARDDMGKTCKAPSNAENICSDEEKTSESVVVGEKENEATEQIKTNVFEEADWSGEAEELRMLMEGYDVSCYMDETESLLTPTDDPNDIELTEEQKNLSLEERKRIARRKYHVEKERTIRRLRRGTAFINEDGETETMKTLLTPQKMEEEKKKRIKEAYAKAGKKRSETCRKKRKLLEQKTKKRGRPRKNPIEDKKNNYDNNLKHKEYDL